MECASPFARQQELATEQVHLDLAALPPAVVDDPILANGGSFRWPRGIDVVGDALDPVVAERGVTEFVAHQEGLEEGCSRVPRA